MLLQGATASPWKRCTSCWLGVCWLPVALALCQNHLRSFPRCLWVLNVGVLVWDTSSAHDQLLLAAAPAHPSTLVCCSETVSMDAAAAPGQRPQRMPLNSADRTFRQLRDLSFRGATIKLGEWARAAQQGRKESQRAEVGPVCARGPSHLSLLVKIEECHAAEG